MESGIAPALLSVGDKLKDRITKDALLRSAELVAKAVHPSVMPDYNFRHREALLDRVVAAVAPAAPVDTPELRQRALHAAASLLCVRPAALSAWAAH
jgi:hypothetical protein